MKKISATAISLSGTGYITVDLTDYVGDDAGNVAGFVLRYSKSGDNTYIAWRMPGEGGQDTSRYRGYHYAYVGCNSSEEIEIYRSATTEHTFWVVGYMLNDEAVFINPKQNVSPLGDTGWQTVDVSAYIDEGDTAIIGLFDIVNLGSSTSYSAGLRQYGSSTDGAARGTLGAYQRFSACIGLEGNGLCEFYKTNANVRLNFVGYMKANVIAYEHIDKSTETTGSYVNVDVTSDVSEDATGVWFFMDGSGSSGSANVRDYADDTEDLAYGRLGGSYGWVPTTEYLLQQKISATSLDLYIIGESQGDVQGSVTPFKMNDVEWANIATFAGVSSANIKTVDGVSPD